MKGVALFSLLFPLHLLTQTVEAPLELNAEPGAYTHVMRWRNGVQPLTTEVVPIAIRANTREGGYSPEQNIFVLRTTLINAKQFPDGSLDKRFDTAFKVEQAGKAFPYAVRVTTPFTRVAMQAANARRKFEDAPKPNTKAETQRGVEIYVLPASITSDPIENLVVRRGTATHRPAPKSSTTPFDMQTVFGVTIKQTMGVYSFPLSVFSPGESITLAFIGASRTIEWQMTSRELEFLR